MTSWAEPEATGARRVESPASGAQTPPRADLVAPATCEAGAHCLVVARVDCPAGTRCDLDVPGRLGAFEVVEVRQTGEGDAGSRLHEWQLTLIAFDPGEVDLPEIGIRVVRTADGAAQLTFTPTGRIDVSLAAAADDAPLRDDARPLDPGPDWRVVASGALGVALVLAVLLSAWRAWRARARRPSPAAAEPGAVAAITTIEALASHPASTPDDTLARYQGLSDALRGYLGLPLDVPAIALTSTEIVGAIDLVRKRARERAGIESGSGRPAPSGDAGHERTRQLLAHIDEVKFGGSRPADPARIDASRRAIALIEDLERTREAEAAGHVA